MDAGLKYFWLGMRALRPINLVLIALTPPALWIVFVTPLLSEPLLKFEQVCMLGAALALMAGAGNVANDIADRTIDRLNDQPNPLNMGLSVQAAWGLYGALTAVAALLTWQLAGELNLWSYAILLPAVAIMLLLYAFTLKCLPWIGNLCVALLCAAVPGMLFLAEPALSMDISGSLMSQSLLAYVSFAFFGSWARELAKDVEDAAGDKAAGCRTLAVRWPAPRVILVIWGLLFVTLATVAYLAGVWYQTGEWVLAFSWGALWMLMASVVANTSRDFNAKQAKALSRHLKLALGFGLVILLLAGARL